jgi:hypothetical protein
VRILIKNNLNKLILSIYFCIEVFTILCDAAREDKLAWEMTSRSGLDRCMFTLEILVIRLLLSLIARLLIDSKKT